LLTEMQGIVFFSQHHHQGKVKALLITFWPSSSPVFLPHKLIFQYFLFVRSWCLLLIRTQFWWRWYRWHPMGPTLNTQGGPDLATPGTYTSNPKF
jgi:hypothetical protein